MKKTKIDWQAATIILVILIGLYFPARIAVTLIQNAIEIHAER